MAHRSRRTIPLVATAMVLMVALPATTMATHSWGGYHWSRASNPFDLDLGDAVGSAWTDHLVEASMDCFDPTLVAT